MDKKVLSVHKAHEPHMVGDGLPVRNFFSYGDLGRDQLSPFLMMDYGSPSEFAPTKKKLGVGMHPHRGFETVTLVFQGGLSHKDTAGNHGDIGPGDVQWMTAGSGLEHEELHSQAFRESGGTLEMLQLWVNLPADSKMTRPKYQTLLDADIPVVVQGASKVRVISGALSEISGPASTFTPVNLGDIQIAAGGKVVLDVPEGYTTALVGLGGKFKVSGSDVEYDDALVILDRKGTHFEISSESGAHVVLLNGERIEEPVVGYGPFVMNTQDQIMEAVDDYRKGRFASAQPTGR